MYELIHLDEINLDESRVQWTNLSKKGGEGAQEIVQKWEDTKNLAVTGNVFVTTSSTIFVMSRRYV